MFTATDTERTAKSPRVQERILILYGGLYLYAGILILLFSGYLDQITNKYWALIIPTGTILAFLAVSVIWQWTKFQAEAYLLPVTFALISTGLIFLYRLKPEYAIRQFAWLVIGLIILILVTGFLRQYRTLAEYQYIYAVLGAIALLLPIFIGKEQGGSRSWLDFALFQVQPSEFVKLLLVLFLAAYLAESRVILTRGTRNFLGLSLPGPREWGPMLAMWGIAMMLLVFQKDLGTALIYFCTFLVMVYAATARILYVVFGGFAFLISGVSSYYFFGHVKARVDIWLNPWPHYETTGYQVIQSLFAIGSGGFFGTGLGAGSPELIPAVHTDFIYSAICEEMGLLGGCGIILLFIIFVYRGLKIALEANDDFSALLATGLTAIMALQSFIIVAGVIKLLPLTGVTLPFISYGGSSLVANFVLLGLLLNVSHAVRAEK